MRAKKLTAIFICGVTVAALLLAGVFLSTHIEHDCTGNHCLVCDAMAACGNLLRSLVGLLIFLGLFLPEMLAAQFGRPASAHHVRPTTLVSLKVKLLN
ncbi:MAG: AraC family transcriptional regulator [Christensenellaceae bacterium]|nr:AraC family transcriptional regulator [Christensenellaceae bacterium]MEA5065924.1 AraC family transcriptional regulator [Eubacteriales bacterium]MEA5068111.1 AraC family transcriptional regulator [Christensenellaceae bacterium]